MPNDQSLSLRGALPTRSRKIIALPATLFIVGGLSTGLWLAATQSPDFRSRLLSLPVVASMLVCVLLTTLNLMVRWFRWHFLIRRFTPQLITRDSLAVYLATLPAIISPFFIAELVRVLIIRRRFHTPASFLVRIWLTERFLDFGVVATALLFSVHVAWGALATLALLLAAAVLFRTLLRAKPRSTVSAVTLAALVTTSFAWAMPVFALALTLRLLDDAAGLGAALRAFTAGTLFGGLSGLPLGVFVTGSTMIGELLLAGASPQASVLAILVHRTGTAWFAVLLGLVSLVVFRRRLARMLKGEAEGHFDEIASEYEGEIPAHVRDRLLGKKVALMARTLQEHGIARGARGLDLGCGQGWYLGEMRKQGYRVDGTDYSAGQLQRAGARQDTQGATLVQADAQALPFADNSFDFVYSINAIHHILAPGAQLRALREIVRVLRPGAVFLLHEINTYNPVFRWYMGYLFPLLKKIDEGNEEWILPTALPETPGARWSTERIQYFTFLPDFVPQAVLKLLAGLERSLERSRFRSFSAHYQACLIKDGAYAATARLPNDPSWQ